MKKIWRPLLLLALIAFIFGAIPLISYTDSLKEEEPTARIGVIVYGDSTDRWQALEQGIRQACIELGIEKPAITVISADDPDRQAKAVLREAANADGILLAAGDMTVFDYGLDAAGVKIVCIESGGGDSYPLVAADNMQMGRDLADYVAAQEGEVTVLKENLNQQSVNERYIGFMERMEELGQQVDILEREPESDIRQFIALSLAKIKESDTLVVLDNNSLEAAIEAAPAAMREDIKIYGVGSTSKAVHGLDAGTLSGIVYTNEYAMGYIGAMTLALEMGLINKTEYVPIQYSFVNRETMFETEMERALFPISQ